MNDVSISNPALPTHLSIWAILGLSKNDGGDWIRLRSVQYATLHSTAATRRIMQMSAATATVMLLINRLPNAYILIWLALLAITQWYTIKVDSFLAVPDKGSVSRNEIVNQAISSVASGIAWAAPLGLISFYIEPQIQIKIWAVLAMLMAASVILLPAAPLNTVLFSLIVGGSAIVHFLLLRSYDMAAIALLFLGIVVVGAIEGAKRYLTAKIIETHMLEKEEVVSLLLREFEEGKADWLWEIDRSHQVLSVSPRFAYALERDAQDIVGKSLIYLLTEGMENKDRIQNRDQLKSILNRPEPFSNLEVMVSINGKARWWALSGTPRFNENNSFDGFRGVGSDVTEAHENSEKIAWLARYDTLTGLPNRTMLTETLSSALEHADNWHSRCVFLMIDLDRFKAVNDTLGHHVGDKLLTNVAQRLQSLMSVNEVCGRLGGDEFAIVMKEISDKETIQHLAERVVRSLSQPYDIDQHRVFIGASVGSAIAPTDGSDVETLMRCADLALYRSKDAGGDGYQAYEPLLHTHAEERRKLEYALRHALDNGEFNLLYQPIVDSESEEIVSFEALLRWHSKDHGIISPDKFVPMAEDTRLIVPIGAWVLHEACKEAMKWPEHVRVAVNVSGEQILHADFICAIKAALTSSGLPAHRLEIEVTETIFLRDAVQTRSTLQQIMDLGCRMALDDFGTGYSSFGYLRKFRFSTIKVDRSFVIGAAQGHIESLAIIRAVVAMADSLGISTIAEGAETLPQVDLIRQLGCREIQGYYFGKPMHASQAQAIFQTENMALA